jgi:hypothetical protein
MGLPPHADPLEVVAIMLRQLALYCTVDRIFVEDNPAISCRQARAVVLHMKSDFH